MNLKMIAEAGKTFVGGMISWSIGALSAIDLRGAILGACAKAAAGGEQ